MLILIEEKISLMQQFEIDAKRMYSLYKSLFQPQSDNESGETKPISTQVYNLVPHFTKIRWNRNVAKQFTKNSAEN